MMSPYALCNMEKILNRKVFRGLKRRAINKGDVVDKRLRTAVLNYI